VARVDSFRLKVDSAPAPDGRTYVRDYTLDHSGNAMMQPFTQSERREITNLVALPDESAPENAMGQR
jgi:hypothetical protein